MRAIRLAETGLPLIEAELDEPALSPDTIKVAVEAAGICRSDAHYRSGFPKLTQLPRTLGHEVAGTVEAVGAEVRSVSVGQRVALHYLVTCGECRPCVSGQEQFCRTQAMLGKEADGGFAEFIAVPAVNAFILPDEVAMTTAAVMMCSTATSHHALTKARLSYGESVAVFGIGGLGMSAIQLARLHGAGQVFAIDVNPLKLDLARRAGAIPIEAQAAAVGLRTATGGAGVDVALDLVGSAEVIRQGLDALAPMGRLVAVGLTPDTIPVGPYTDLVTDERELIGASDHLASEIPQLLEWASQGALDFSHVVSETVPLDALAINDVLDRLEGHGDSVRSVVVP